ncbi:hypothetical protein CLAN_1280 [Campylobacter lanienae NCTC 13004]|uniref:Uncharacterized protein n=1 Tax=Campylobacter lanienae NCTC 13004 TaxID=1031753 RepID=A0A1X9SP27_9BACT|nr:hypothetical protein CLAN_1280 [Campylobacter lanienae NCTC 13004]
MLNLAKSNGAPYKNPWRGHPLKGFSRGLGVVKGEAKVLLSFVASQTMIYIVVAVTLLICQKALPLPLKKRKI